MTLPPDPSLFLAHCKAHKTSTQSQPCKELKNPSHSPPTPADGTPLDFTPQHQLYYTINKPQVLALQVDTYSP